MRIDKGKVGDVLSVPKGPFNHKGVLFSGDRVLHASKRRGQVVLDDIDAFALGKQIHNEGCPSKLKPHEIVERGNQLIGRPYDLFNANCDHLVSDVHNLGTGSPQLKNWAVAAIAVFAVMTLTRTRA